jgi:hypothetical protein
MARRFVVLSRTLVRVRALFTLAVVVAVALVTEACKRWF